MSVLLSRRGLLVMACSHATVPARGQTLQCDGIAAAPPVSLSPAEMERHRIFLLLAMALVHAGWNLDPDPALRATYALRAQGRNFGYQAGHNIGAVLVEGDEVLCFALNRNLSLRSTLEHAEARAVRRAFVLGNARLTGNPDRFAYSSLLRSATLYATLEPCSQCAGIIDLANIPRMVFAQRDPSQRCISNILYNLHRDSGPAGAALPIHADFLPSALELDAAYQDFRQRRPGQGPSGPTAFLETPDAYDIFTHAANSFATMPSLHPENADALRNARRFLDLSRPQLLSGEGP